MDLQAFFKKCSRVALGLSGGVDSAYLLYAAASAGADVKAYFVKSAFQPGFELEDAEKAAAYVGVGLEVVEPDVLAAPGVASNPEDRCYHCKRVIFGAIAGRAAADDRVLIDGSNASDDAGSRPGMRALAELGVRSPLRECGLAKADVRMLAKEAGLHVWDKPAYACLATRIPTGQPITASLLGKIERAEGALFDMGFSDFRVRVIGGAARLQFPAAQMEKAFARRGEITCAVGKYFKEILLDLECRGLS